MIVSCQNVKTHTNKMQQVLGIYNLLSLYFVSQWGFYRKVRRMRWDCGKTPILINIYLTEIPSHCIVPLQIWKMRWERNGSQVRSPSKNTKLSQTHLVHVFEKYSCTGTRFSSRKFRGRGGGPEQ